MPCLAAPQLPAPTLPSPFTLEPPELPGFSGNVALCCKSVQFSAVLPPLPLPPFVLNPAAIAIVFQAAAALNSWLASLKIDCPKE